MNLPPVFRRAADLEFEESAVWYEEVSPGLGTAFVDEVNRILSRIQEQPDRYPIVRKDIREAPLSRFPYCIYYRLKPDRIVIIAVMHTSRDPAIWQSRN
jgi:toxin ParE1/3/4